MRRFQTAVLMLILAAFPGMSGLCAEEEGEPSSEAVEKTAEAGSEDGDKAEKPPLQKARDDLREKLREIRRVSEPRAGLFPYRTDQRDGTVYLELGPEHFDRPFIHFTHTVNGVVAANHFRGRFGDARIIHFERRFDAVNLRAENHAFHFDPESALSRAADANISDAVLVTAKIVAEDFAGGKVYIKADDLFLLEFLEQVKPSDPKKPAEDRFELGELSKDRTQFTHLAGYPDNSVFRVLYTYENFRPKVRGEADVTDARAVGIELQHTLMSAPENHYVPRRDDPRVGYFLTQVTDLTSTSNTPYRDVIHRWHLEPKEPGAAISEPVEPITFWMENTTPVELRDTIRTAALLWNEAFASAGWKNALEIRQQPDDAEWNADDVRYHVLRWTSSPDPPFGGYGPSFVDPRTGQILGADIMLEWSFLSNRVRYRKIFQGEPALLPGAAGHHCFLSDCLQHGNAFGLAAQKLGLLGDTDGDRLIREALHYLVLHEIGHTLGLAHNFQGSTWHGLEAIHDPAVTERDGVAASVMDYPAVNVAPPGAAQGSFYNVRPGKYDHWAISYGYSRGLDDPAAEEARLEALLARSTEPGLGFGNDADDMRSPGKGIDPRNMIGDLSKDALGYAEARLETVLGLLDALLERSPEPGRSFQTVRDERSVLMREYRGQIAVISRHVGGVWVNRAVAGQETEAPPFTPVPALEQRRALDLLERFVWREGWQADREALYRHLQEQRRGWDFEESGEDPKLLDEYAGVGKTALDHLFHPHTTTRMLNSSLYGNELGFDAVLETISVGVIPEPWQPSQDLVRQSLQREFVERLIAMAGLEGSSPHPHPAQVAALGRIDSVARNLEVEGDPQARLLRLRIHRALEGPR